MPGFNGSIQLSQVLWIPACDLDTWNSDAYYVSQDARPFLHFQAYVA